MFARFLHYARGSVGALILVVPIAAAIEIAVSYLLQAITDTATGQGPWRYQWLIVVVAGYIVVDAGMTFASTYLAQATLNRIIARVRQDLLTGLFQQRTGVGHDGQAISTGYYNDFTNTLTILREDYLQSGVNIYRQLCQFVIAMACSLMIKPALSLLIVLLCLPGLALPFFRQRRLKQNKQSVLTATAALNRVIQDLTGGLRTIQLFNLQGQLQRRFARHNRWLLIAQNQDQRVRKTVGGLSQLLDNLLYLGTWTGGIYFVMTKTITLGQLVAFSQLMIFIVEPIQSASGLIGDLVGGRAAAEQISRQLGRSTVNYPRQLTGLERIDYQHVTLAGTEQNRLSNVQLTLKTTQRYLIVGKSGSGKSTLINLPLSFGTSVAGQMSLNGVPLGDFAPASVYRHLGLLDQTSYLFDASLADNLALYDHVAPDRLITVLRLVGLTQYATPAGLKVAVSDQGNGLSGGERRRLALARVLLHPTDFTFLDEPLSGLDPRTAHDMVGVITQQLTGGWAVVTHQYDATLFAAADQVIVLNQGRIVAQGGPQTANVRTWLGRLNLQPDV